MALLLMTHGQVSVYEDDCTVVAGVCGTAGSTADKLNKPSGIAIDDNGDLLVASYQLHKVMKFAQGQSTGTKVAGGTTGGNAANQLKTVQDIFWDSENGAVLCSEGGNGNDRVSRWSTTTTGTVIAGGNGRGSNNNQLNANNGVLKVGTDLYVADSTNHRIMKYDLTSNPPSPSVFIATDDTNLKHVSGLLRDADGNFYASGTSNQKIVKYNSAGVYQSDVAGTGTSGTSLGAFNGPMGMAFAPDGSIVVADRHNNRVMQWDPNAAPGATGVQVGSSFTFNSPWDVTVDSSGDVYVSNFGSHCVAKCRLATTTTSTATTATVTTATATPTTETTTITETVTSTASSTTTLSTVSSTSSTSQSTSSTSLTTTTSSTASSSTTSSSTFTSSTSTSESSTSSTLTSSSSTTVSSTSSTSSSASSTTSSSMSSSSTSSSSSSTSESSTSSSSSSASSTSSSSISSSSSSSTSSSSTSSSSSSSSSSQTSTTSSSSTSSGTETTTTTTTSTLTVPENKDWAELGAFARFHELDIISKLLALGSENFTKAVPGAVFAGRRLQIAQEDLRPDGTASRNITMDVAGTRVGWPQSSMASVTLPMDAVLRRVGLTDVVLVAGLMDVPERSGERDSAGRPVQVHSMMSVNLFSTKGEELTVDKLNESIVLAMPVNHTESFPLKPLPECAYFDEEADVWQDLFGELTWGQLTCSTTHLTFFASILKGFLDALLCSQLSLFSAQGMARLFKGDWHSSTVAMIFWLFEVCLLALMVAACVADRRTNMGRVWDDRDYLIPTSSADADAVVEEEEALHGAVAAAKGCATSCKESCSSCDVCKDIADEFISSWLHWFSKVRSLVEGISQSMSGGQSASEGSTAMRMANGATDALIVQSVRSQVSFHVAVSYDTVNYILSDEDFGDLILKADPTEAPAAWRERLEAWHGLHDRLVHRTDAAWHGHSWCALPYFAARLLIVANPIVSVLLFDCFMPSKMRALLFISELLGASMTACLFFAGTGSATSALNGAECTEPKNIWEELGQIIAVATFSLLLGGIPASIIGSLHSREFKQMDYEGSPQWTKQLKHWRTQDWLFWIFGLSYVTFCSFTIMLFLANVNVQDLPEWGISSLTQVLEDTIVMPALVAALMPILTMLAIALVSVCLGMHHTAHLEQRKLKLDAGKGNYSARQRSGLEDGRPVTPDCRVSV